MTTGKRRWNELLDIEDMEWKLIHKLPFVITKKCKLQWFQYRIINNILATNPFLFKIKKVNSKMCTFCHREEETIEHILWDCDSLEEKINFKVTFTKKTFILGILGKSKDILNIIFLW